MDKYLYLTLFSLSTLLFITTPVDNYKIKGWYYKSLLINIASFFLLYSMFYSNYYIDNYFVFISISLNVLLLIPMVLENYSENKIINNTNLLLLTGLIIYILLNRKLFLVSKGKFVNNPKNLIYAYIIILSIFFLSSSLIDEPYSSIFLILIPLLFPIECYGLYRVILLQFFSSINYKFKLWEKLN